METIAQASPATAARQVMCSQCWAPPGTPCQQHPAGSHLARYQDAERRGVLSRQALAAVIAQLDVIAGHVIIPDGAR
jgi:hypothetical protein